MAMMRAIAERVQGAWRVRVAPSKFLAYFALLDALTKPGCPVCHLLVEHSRRALDGFFYESVTDPISRARLVASRGFCNYHAWMSAEVPNSASGVATIHEHLLSDEIERLRSLLSHREKRPRWRRVLERVFGRNHTRPGGPAGAATPCPICGFAASLEANILDTLLDFLSDPALRHRFDTSAGLCLPHLDRAIGMRAEHPHLGLLLEKEVAKLQELSWRLREFGRKIDWRYRDEARGLEQRAWLQSIEILVGKAGLFGPERGIARFVVRVAGPAGQPSLGESGPPPEEGAEAPAEEGRALDAIERAGLEARLADLARAEAAERERASHLAQQVHRLTHEIKVLQLELAEAGARISSEEARRS